MTLNDWFEESVHRFQTQRPTTAAKGSTRAFIRGGVRRVGRHIGSPIWEHKGWDVLVVLDACRTDLIREVIDEYPPLPDPHEVSTVWSNASCSIDWINRNFNQYPRHARRTGYVTANPFADHGSESAQSADLSKSDIGYFEPMYRTHWQDVTSDGLATETHRETGRAKVGSGIATVPPRAVTDHTITAWRTRHELRIDQLVAHYMQPHEPYRSRPNWVSGDHKLLENMVTDGESKAGRSIWPKLQKGEIPMEEFWEVYKDNLRWVLDDVTERLLPNVQGRVVLTADHGNALGEWGEWHHPPGAIGPSVRRVPWVTIDATDTESIQPDIETGESDAGAEEQLKALGYL